MAKSQGESPNKKDLEKKKNQKRKEKEARREERRAQSKEGRSFEDMIAYIDENGNITSTPPDPTKKKVEINMDDIVIGSRNVGGNDAGALVVRQGRVTFFNTSKGYGFIRDLNTQESIFVHINALGGAPIKENDKVTYDVEHGPKGLNAVRVKVIN